MFYDELREAARRKGQATLEPGVAVAQETDGTLSVHSGEPVLL